MILIATGGIVGLAEGIIDDQLSWINLHPIREINFRFEILNKLENRNFTLDRLREMNSKDIGSLIHHFNAGETVKKAAFEIPTIDIDANIQPITRTVLRVRLSITPNFKCVYKCKRFT